MLPGFLALALPAACLADEPEADPALALSERLSALGAASLARSYLDARQPDLVTRPGAWARWERARLEALRDAAMWRHLVQRRDAYPPAVPPAIRVLADELAAEALVRLGDGARARALADGLLAAGPVDGGRRDAWWRLRVRADLVAELAGEARAALVGYRSEFPDDLAGWGPLEARLLLLDGHFEEVLLSLDGMTGTEAALLRLAAVAGSGGGDPWRFREAATPLLDPDAVAPAVRYQAWALVGRVAARFGEIALQAEAFENALAEAAATLPAMLLARVSADDLWVAYLALAQQAGNEARLLVGRHDDWLALAERLSASDPLAARATLAFLALEASAPEVREVAAGRLAAATWADVRLRAVAASLWLGAERIGSLDAIPDAIRPVLIVDLVRRGRFEAAGAVAPEPFAIPPATEPAPPWLAPYGHALIRAGMRRDGAAILVAAARQTELGPGAWWGPLIAAIRDLEAAGEPDLALELIAAAAEAGDASHRAALAFMAAESQAAAGRHRAAALAYLEAGVAMEEGDPARPLARLLAARALFGAGLADDGEGVLRELARELAPGALAARLAGESGP